MWDKGHNGGGDLRIPWKPSFELVFIFGQGWRGHRGPGVIRHVVHSHVSAGRKHPTEKPIKLLEEIITKAPDAELVLDPCAGSGTTLKAAKNPGRRAIGIELEESYCQAAVSRLIG